MKHLLRTTQPYLYHIGTSLLLSCLPSLTIWGYYHPAHLFSRAGPPVRLFVANAECGVNVRIPSTPSCVSGKLILGGHRRWQPHFRLVAALPDLTLPPQEPSCPRQNCTNTQSPAFLDATVAVLQHTGSFFSQVTQPSTCGPREAAHISSSGSQPGRASRPNPALRSLLAELSSISQPHHPSRRKGEEEEAACSTLPGPDPHYIMLKIKFMRDQARSETPSTARPLSLVELIPQKAQTSPNC